MEACGRGSEGSLWFVITPVIPEPSARRRPTGVSRLRNAPGRDDAMLLATLARGAIAYRSGRFAAVATTKAMPSSSFVISIAEASDGNIWLGTRDAGLVRVQASASAGTPSACRISRSTACCRECWRGVIGTDRGVGRWNGTEITSSGVPAALQQTTALNMIRDRASNIWIAAIPRGPAPEPQRIGAISVGGRRRNSLRGSRWNVRRHRSRSRTVARSCVYHVFGCARHACGRRGPSMPTSPGGMVRAIQRRIVLDPATALSRKPGTRGLPMTWYSIHGGDGEAGRQATRWRDAAPLPRGRDGGRTLHTAAGSGRKTASSRSTALVTAPCGREHSAAERACSADGSRPTTQAMVFRRTRSRRFSRPAMGRCGLGRRMDSPRSRAAAGGRIPLATAALERHQRSVSGSNGRDLGWHCEGYCDCRAWSREARMNSRPRDFRDRFSDSPMIAVARSGSMSGRSRATRRSRRAPPRLVAARRREGYGWLMASSASNRSRDIASLSRTRRACGSRLLAGCRWPIPRGPTIVVNQRSRSSSK